MAEENVATTPEKPPMVGWLSLGFLRDAPEFTKKALQKHGHVWTTKILLSKQVYGIGGGAGLRLFYDEANVLRFPAAQQNLFDCGWKLESSYAIPPLDGDEWKRRKWHLMDTVTTKDLAQKYLAALDGSYVDAISKLGADGNEFSMWDALNRMVLVGLSKQFFGYSLDDYEVETDKLIANIQLNFTVFGNNGKVDNIKTCFHELLEYLAAVLDKVKADPVTYKDTALAQYLAKEGAPTKREDILLDMHQMLIVGAYGICTQGACLIHSLANHPEVRERVAAEVAEKLSGAPSFSSLRELPFTFAVVKEALRYWPAVHAVAGVTVRDIVHENKLIPKGVPLLAVLYGTCHDPTVFKTPERFDPDRFLPPRSEGSDEAWDGWLVAFGAGDSTKGHACAGKNVAITFLLDLTVRLVQGWAWELVNSREKILTDRIGPVPSDGLRMRRV